MNIDNYLQVAFFRFNSYLNISSISLKSKTKIIFLEKKFSFKPEDDMIL